MIGDYNRPPCYMIGDCHPLSCSHCWVLTDHMIALFQYAPIVIIRTSFLIGYYQNVYSNKGSVPGLWSVITSFDLAATNVDFYWLEQMMLMLSWIRDHSCDQWLRHSSAPRKPLPLHGERGQVKRLSGVGWRNGLHERFFTSGTDTNNLSDINPLSAVNCWSC